MIRITEAQRAALQADRHAYAVGEIRRFLAETVPEALAVLSPAAQEKRLRGALDKADRYGLHSLRESARYAAFDLIFGEDFDRDRAARRILEDTATPGWRRLDALTALAEGQPPPHGARPAHG